MMSLEKEASIERLGTIQVYGITLQVSSSGHNLPLQQSSGHPVIQLKPENGGCRISEMLH